MTLRTSLTVGGDASGAKKALQDTEAGLKKVKRGAKETSDALERSSRSQGGAAPAIEKTRRASEGLSKAQKAAASHTANLTAQLNDIGVMLAAGQNPLQLAMQQGTQINQVFAQMGGGVGALRAIGGAFVSMLSPVNLATIGIIGFGAYGVQALRSLGGETLSLEDRLAALEERAGSVSDQFDVVQMSSTELRAEFGAIGAYIQELNSGLADWNMEDVLSSAVEEVRLLSSTWGEFVVVTPDEFAQEVSGLESVISSLRAEFDLSKDAAWSLASSLETLNAADGLEAQAAAARDLTSAIEEAFPEGPPEGLVSIVTELEKILSIAARAEAQRDASRRAYESDLEALNAETELMRERLRLGEDTLAYQQAKADAALEAYRVQVMERDISDDMKTDLISAYEVQQDLILQAWEHERALAAGEAAARSLGRALDAAAGFSTDLGGQISVLHAELNALQSGADATIARQIAADRQRAASLRDASVAAGLEVGIAHEIYQTTLNQIETKERLLNQQSALTESARSHATAARSTNREYERLQSRITDMNRAADPLLRYNESLKELQELQRSGLSEAAYTDELQKLNDQLADSVPLVGEVADAWGQFVTGGLEDFRSFVDAVWDSFRNLIAKMAATAAQNTILIGLGLMPAGATAGTFGGTLSGAMGLGGKLFGTLGSGLLSGAPVFGSGFLGGLGATASATFGAGGGLGGLLSIGSNAALAGGGAMATLGAAVPVLGVAAAAVSFLKSKTKELDSGLRLTAKGASILAYSMRTIEKSRFWGLKKSTYTEYSLIDNTPFREAYNEVYKGIRNLAAELSIGAETFHKFSYDVTLSLKGLDEAARSEALEKTFTAMADKLAVLALGTGATAAELESLVFSLNVANDAFEMLGLNVYSASVHGAQAAQNMLSHFESLEAFTSSVSYYYQNFYTEAERLDVATRDLSEVLHELGVSTLPQTRAEFRSLVDSMSEAGLDEAVATLLQVAPVFAEIETAWREAADAAEASALEMYNEALGIIDRSKSAVIDAWSDILHTAEDSTRSAAARVQSEMLFVNRVFRDAGSAFASLMDVAQDRVQRSETVVTMLSDALNERRKNGDSEIQQRSQALAIIQSGDRSRLEQALGILSGDSSDLYSDRASYQRSFARETAAIQTLLTDTEAQLTVEEQSLSSLKAQADSLTSIQDILDEQLAIANGQLVTLEDAVAAIYGTGTDQVSQIMRLIDVAIMGDTAAQSEFVALGNGADLASGVMEFISGSIDTLNKARADEEATRATANEYIDRAVATHAQEVAALNKAYGLEDQDSDLSILQLVLEQAGRQLGTAPEALSIVAQRGFSELYGIDLSSVVVLSDGQRFSSKSGDTREELETARKLAQPYIDASVAALSSWQSQYDALEPLRDRIRALGAIPSFNGGGWTGDGARVGGVDGMGGFIAMLHPREAVIDTTKFASPRIVADGRADADNNDLYRVMAAVRREIELLRSEARLHGNKIALNTTRLAQKARDDERLGAPVRVLEGSA